MSAHDAPNVVGLPLPAQERYVEQAAACGAAREWTSRRWTAGGAQGMPLRAWGE